VASTTALAAALVLRHLGTKPLWLDETVSISVVRRHLPAMLAVLPHHDGNAGLYYLLLHGWLYLGHGAAWDRGPSAICFVGTAGLAAWAGTRWRGAWLGLACGVLVATNHFLLFYGQEARPYSLAVLLAVASTVALFWHDDKPALGPYVALTAALLYADLFAVLFVVAQVAALIVIYRRRGQPVPKALWRGWAVIAAITAPFALPMLVWEHSQISWLTKPTLQYLGQTFTAMMNGGLGLAVTAGLIVFALIAVRRPSSRRAATRDRLVVPTLLVAFAVPPVLLWLIAQVVPTFIDRYIICSTVAAIGLAAFGLDVIRRRASAAMALTTMIVLAALGGQQIATLEAQSFKYENPPNVVSFIARQARPDDAVGFAGGGLRTVIDAYLRPGGSFPFDIAVAPGGEATRQHDIYAREVNPATLWQRLAGVQRLWLVTDPTNGRYPPYGPFASLRPGVTREFQPTIKASFPGIDVTLYTRKGSSS
jgi:mannosyltransferase